LAIILHIETATKNCSVALSEDGRLIDYIEEYSERYSHSERLHILIETLFKRTSFNLQSVKAVAVSKGPGSYTGLRIATSSAKGLCFALKIPLIAIDTITIMVKGQNTIEADYFVPMIDARRMEVYTAVVYPNLNFQKEIHALVINENSFDQYRNEKLVFMGSGIEKCKPFLQLDNFVCLKDVHPSARDMVTIAHEKYQAQAFENLAYFEPFYLKDFVGISSRPLQNT